MQQLTLLCIAILVGFAAAVPVNEDARPTEDFAEAPVVEGQRTEPTKTSLPGLLSVIPGLKVLTCFVKTAPSLIKCFSHKPTNTGLQLRHGYWQPQIYWPDIVFFLKECEQWGNNDFWPSREEPSEDDSDSYEGDSHEGDSQEGDSHEGDSNEEDSNEGDSNEGDSHEEDSNEEDLNKKIPHKGKVPFDCISDAVIQFGNCVIL